MLLVVIIVSSLCLPAVTVRLVNGPDNLHGRVIVNYYGLDGTICDDGFGASDARVVCRMLGYG